MLRPRNIQSRRNSLRKKLRSWRVMGRARRSVVPLSRSTRVCASALGVCLWRRNDFFRNLVSHAARLRRFLKARQHFFPRSLPSASVIFPKRVFGARERERFRKIIRRSYPRNNTPGALLVPRVLPLRTKDYWSSVSTGSPFQAGIYFVRTVCGNQVFGRTRSTFYFLYSSVIKNVGTGHPLI